MLVSGGCAGTAPAPSTAPAAQIATLEARVAQRPADVRAAVQLGGAYRVAGRLGDARRVLEDAHRRAPRHGGATALLGLTCEDQGDFACARPL